jgi:ornithine cyclodeaminase
MANLEWPGLARHPPVHERRQAVRGADIVTTVTADKANATILTPEMIEPGMHLNAVGGDCPGKTELHRGVLRRPRSSSSTSRRRASRATSSRCRPTSPVTEFWQVLAGSAPGRTSAAQVTVFDSVGFALEDYSALRFLRTVICWPRRRLRSSARPDRAAFHEAGVGADEPVF